MRLLREYALSFLGQPYHWGGDDPIDGFDCSGLVQEILASVGEDPAGDQTAQKLHDYFAQTCGKPSRPELGALAFYGRSVKQVTHVAFCLDGARVLEAGGGGATCLSLVDAARLNAFVRIRPLTRRPDLVAVYLPLYLEVTPEK